MPSPQHPLPDAATGAQADSASTSIDIDTPQGLERWSKELKVPAEALRAAVKAVGTQKDRVLDYLGPKSAGAQQDG